MSSRLKTRLRKYKPLLSAYEWFWVKLQNSNKLNTHFYNLTDSFSLCNNWAYKIPNEFDVIIGVPRAGLMFANILACRLGRPLSTPDNFLRGEIWFSHDAIPPEKIKKVLLVEDSVGFGNQITNAYQKLKEAFPDLQIEKACLFASPKGIDKVDYAFSKELPPYLFEWNILTATWGWGEVVSDLDGVLCFDCPIDWDDGQKNIMNL